MAELVFNVLLLIFFIAMTAYGMTIQIWGEYWAARYYPVFLLVIAVILFTAKVIKIWKKLTPEQRKFNLDFLGLKNKDTQRLLIGFALLLAYAAIIPYLGYILSTIALVTALSMLLGAGDIRKALLTAVIITVVIYAIFVWGLSVRPPRGVGPLYNISMWIENLI